VFVREIAEQSLALLSTKRAAQAPHARRNRIRPVAHPLANVPATAR
jgi:hypothetical protein